MEGSKPLSKKEFNTWAANHHVTLKRKVDDISDKIDEIEAYQAEIFEDIASIRGVNKIMVPLMITLLGTIVTVLITLVILKI